MSSTLGMPLKFLGQSGWIRHHSMRIVKFFVIDAVHGDVFTLSSCYVSLFTSIVVSTTYPLHYQHSKTNVDYITFTLLVARNSYSKM